MVDPDKGDTPPLGQRAPETRTNEKPAHKSRPNRRRHRIRRPPKLELFLFGPPLDVLEEVLEQRRQSL